MPSQRTHKAELPLQFFAPCPRGLEGVLGDELLEIGAGAIVPAEGGVACSGDLALCYRANLHSRIASRVLLKLGDWAYRSEEDVYRTVRSLPWSKHFDPRRTLRVNVSAINSPLRSLDFITLRIKDAVCDRFVADAGRRPDIDTAQPDVRVHAFFESERVTLYLDTSGEPLFKRGWRKSLGEAPLKENLAAGILRLTKWQPGTPLLDPMCGGGTLLVEAAMMALRIAPGSMRGFGFENRFKRRRARRASRCMPYRFTERTCTVSNSSSPEPISPQPASPTWSRSSRPTYSNFRGRHLPACW
jgi:putative N6-adenine-specific DNA methylase